MMTPKWRKAMLTLHVGTSVGWLGAILAYIALNLPILLSKDEQEVRAAYLMMEPVAQYVIAPLAIASLLTGVVQALGTPWGLFRHYWVVISLLITAVATVVLLLHLPTVAAMSQHAASGPVQGMGGDVVHPVLGLLLLLIPLCLNIFKPKGLTRHGWRSQQTGRPTRTSANA